MLQSSSAKPVISPLSIRREAELRKNHMPLACLISSIRRYTLFSFKCHLHVTGFQLPPSGRLQQLVVEYDDTDTSSVQACHTCGIGWSTLFFGCPTGESSSLPATATWPVMSRTVLMLDALGAAHSTSQLLSPTATATKRRLYTFCRAGQTGKTGAPLRPVPEKPDPTIAAGWPSWLSAGVSNSAAKASFAAAQSILRGPILASTRTAFSRPLRRAFSAANLPRFIIPQDRVLLDPGETLRWIKAFPSNRKFQVKLDSTYPSSTPVSFLAPFSYLRQRTSRYDF
ncbi:hypothetical protein CSKR_106001 [Clonorchis sinensis]|uniref:Uncharacterized protein n=1 Tax=Clonorchis sinensis TaxID=79923 RepID=A0A419PPQ1_CLOSI|nr:hypothetical protein CSKR_106001 [Clonorchis sinensis]